MNNISQKNIILNLKHESDMPYKSTEYINQFQQCESVTNIDVNNAARQLLDNDLYIENYLNMTSSYTIGPKPDTSLDSAPDGYKIYGSLQTEDTLDILRKVEDPLSSTIVKINKDNTKSEFVAYWSDMLFIGYEDSQMKYSFASDISTFFTFPITATNFYSDDNRIIFSATDGIYQLSSAIVEDETSEDYGKIQYGLARLNSNELAELKSVYVNTATQKIVAGGTTCIYEGIYDTTKGLDELYKNIEFESQMLLDDSNDIVEQQVNAIGSTANTDIAGADWIYQRRQQYVYKNSQNIYQYDESGAKLEKKYSVIAEFNGYEYVGSENGLFVIKGNVITKAEIDGVDITDKVVDIKADDSTMYVATEKAVYGISKQLACSGDYLCRATLENRIPSSANISKILVCNKQVHVATDNGLYCFTLDEHIYINEICVNGKIRSLPASDDDLRFKNIIDICVNDTTVIVATSSYLKRFDFTGYGTCNTNVISNLKQYSDKYYETISSERVIKFLHKDDSDIYIVTPSCICNSNTLGLKWKPSGEDETIADASISKIDGELRIFAVTNIDTYILKPIQGSSPVVVAKPSQPIPGVSIAAVGGAIVVFDGNGTCNYVYNSIDKFQTETFKQYECGEIDQLEHTSDYVYCRKNGYAKLLDITQMPRRENIYVGAGLSCYAWSTVQNGYAFVRDGELIFKGIQHQAIQEEGETDYELSVVVLDDVTWYDSAEVTFVYIDDAKNTAYVGTETTLLSAALANSAGERITTPLFQVCVCESGYSFGRVNCICRGFPTGYKYGEYSILVPEDPSDPSQPHAETNIKISTGDSVMVASENGLFELKSGNSAFTHIYNQKYKSIFATKRLFVGITEESAGNSYIHSIANEFTSVELTASGGIKRGTKNDKVTYTEYTVSTSGFNPRSSESAIVPSRICSVKISDTDDSQTIYMAGGKDSIIKNKIANDALSTFELNVSSFGYVQSSVYINSIQQPEDRHDVTWLSSTVDEIDTYDDYELSNTVERIVRTTKNQTYDPICEIVLSADDGYYNYIMYAKDGIYIVDEQNIQIVSESPAVTDKDGNEIGGVRQIRAIDGTLFALCEKGLYTSDRSIIKEEFSCEDIFRTDGLYYIKCQNDWRYMRSVLFLAEDTAENAISLSAAFDQFGIDRTEDCCFQSNASGTVFIGTESAGVGEVCYFQTQVANYTAIEVPQTYQADFNAVSLNSSSKFNNVYVVENASTAGKTSYKIHNYNLITNSDSTCEYRLQTSDDQTNEFHGQPVFVNKDGSRIFYVILDQASRTLYCGKSNILYAMPNFGSGLDLSDIRYAYGSSHTVFARDKNLFVFDEVSDGTVWVKIEDSAGDKVNRIVVTPDNKCLFTASSGLWYYAEAESDEAQGECVLLKEIEGGATGLCRYVEDESSHYIYSSGKSILSSNNYKRWKHVLDWDYTSSGSVTDITSINSIYRLNNRTYFAAANNGAYMTKYSYKTVQDNKAFTKDDAMSVYNVLMQNQISSDISCMISDHISSNSGWHAENSIITRINNDYLNTDLDNIAGWTTSELCNDVSGYVNTTNDIIEEMYFGKYSDGDIAVEVSNFLMSNTTQQTGITYISKKWRSGVTELYVNIPTISSYYIANCFGASNCRHDPHDAYSRKNLEQFGSSNMVQDSTLSTHWTSVSVCVASAAYHIDSMLDIQINGMSLPLAIYKDQTSTGDTGTAGKFFRSYIEPSTIRQYDISKTDKSGNYVFEFACFGTDAQAVKLMFYDKSAYSGRDYIKIVFDSNGGEGTMPNQKFIITEDLNGKTILEQKTLRKCSFTNTSSGHSKIFSGWSVSPLADNSNATYEDMTVFPQYTSGRTFEALMEELGDPSRTEQLRKNEEIKLYAVWLDYEFSDTDTTIMMQSDKSEFCIDSVGIDASTQLGNNVIINFGD